MVVEDMDELMAVEIVPGIKARDLEEDVVDAEEGDEDAVKE